ncbi:hypothetical protein LJR153_007298 [Paenibacillus sp. LjRoot153]
MNYLLNVVYAYLLVGAVIAVVVLIKDPSNQKSNDLNFGNSSQSSKLFKFITITLFWTIGFKRRSKK